MKRIVAGTVLAGCLVINGLAVAQDQSDPVAAYYGCVSDSAKKMSSSSASANEVGVAAYGLCSDKHRVAVSGFRGPIADRLRNDVDYLDRLTQEYFERSRFDGIALATAVVVMERMKK